MAFNYAGLIWLGKLFENFGRIQTPNCLFLCFMHDGQQVVYSGVFVPKDTVERSTDASLEAIAHQLEVDCRAWLLRV